MAVRTTRESSPTALGLHDEERRVLNASADSTLFELPKRLNRRQRVRNYCAISGRVDAIAPRNFGIFFALCVWKCSLFRSLRPSLRNRPPCAALAAEAMQESPNRGRRVAMATSIATKKRC
jgi:hypothetical protein